MRIGREGGEITAHKYIVPFISCSMRVQLIRFFKSPLTEKTQTPKQPNDQNKGFPKGEGGADLLQ